MPAHLTATRHTRLGQRALLEDCMNSLIDPAGPLRRLEIVVGETNPMACRVYARLPGRSSLAGDRLSGSVRGPRCRYSSTLEANLPLVDSGPGESLLAACLVPDPCFWTPQLPFVYSVEVDLHQRDRMLGSTTRLLGVKRIGVDQRRLLFDGLRWRPLACHVEAPPPDELMPWRDAATSDLALSLAVTHPSDALCQEASLGGVPLIVSLDQSDPSPAAELIRLARWPAVCLVLVDERLSLSPADCRAAPNIVVGQIRRSFSSQPPADWAQVLATPGEVGPLESLAESLSVPVLGLGSQFTHSVHGPDAALEAAASLAEQFAEDSPIGGWIA